MKLTRRVLRVTAVLALGVILTQSTLADVIVLKSGRRLEGKVKEFEDMYSLTQADGSQSVIPKRLVKEFIKDSSPAPAPKPAKPARPKPRPAPATPAAAQPKSKPPSATDVGSGPQPHARALVAPGKVRRFVGHDRGINAVAFLPDGLRIVSGGQDKTIRVWDVRTGRQVLKLTGHTSTVTGVACFPDGRRLLSSGGHKDGTIRLWDLKSGKQVGRWNGPLMGTSAVAVSPDGRQVLSGSMDKIVRLWNVETGQPIHVLKGHRDWVTAVGFSPDGRRGVSGSSTTGRSRMLPPNVRITAGTPDISVRIWDLKTGKQISRLTVHPRDIGLVGFSPDGRKVLIGGGLAKRDECALRVCDAGTDKDILAVSYNKWDAVDMHAGVFSPDGRYVLCSGTTANLGSSNKDIEMRGLVSVWDVTNGKEIRRWDHYTKTVRAVAWSPDGRYVVSGGGDGVVGLTAFDQPTARKTTAARGTGRRTSVPGFDTPLGGYVEVLRYSGKDLKAKASLNFADAAYRPIEATELRETVTGAVTRGSRERFYAVRLEAKSGGNAKFRFGDFTLRSGTSTASPSAYSTDLTHKSTWATGPNVISERKTAGSTYLWFKAPEDAKTGTLAYKKQSITLNLAEAKPVGR